MVHQLLRDVVFGGTAKRFANGMTFRRPDARRVWKDGNRRSTLQCVRARRAIESRKVNRTATFVFVIGDRFFGTLTAYVHEPYAARYDFTSALSVQLLKSLAPALQPLLDDDSAAIVSSTATEQ